ncbi:MAG TPA: energy transducer TonB [Sphingobium sp.]|nr:energy transducer TonB [Sphingobium sp.]
MKLKLAGALTLAMLTPCAANAEKQETSVIHGSPPMLIVQAPDYPSEALAEKLSGEIPVELRLDPDGQITCKVTDKRAPAMLGQRSCILVVNRWPFGPQHDAEGRPQSTKISLIVFWPRRDEQTPRNDDLGFGGATPISPQNWLDGLYGEHPSLARYRGRSVLIRFEVSPTGQMRGCAIEGGKQSQLFSAKLCPIVEKRALFLPAVDAQGRAIVAKGAVKFTFG